MKKHLFILPLLIVSINLLAIIPPKKGNLNLFDYYYGKAFSILCEKDVLPKISMKLTNNKLTLNNKNSDSEEIYIEIKSENGNVIFTDTIREVKEKTYNLEKLSSNLYTIYISHDNKSEVHKLYKKDALSV